MLYFLFPLTILLWIVHEATRQSTGQAIYFAIIKEFHSQTPIPKIAAKLQNMYNIHPNDVYTLISKAQEENNEWFEENFPL